MEDSQIILKKFNKRNYIEKWLDEDFMGSSQYLTVFYYTKLCTFIEKNSKNNKTVIVYSIQVAFDREITKIN